jgi:predicted GH43/DUF377 family glycosyl hydrolase
MLNIRLVAKKLCIYLFFLPVSIRCFAEEDILEDLARENHIVLSKKRIYLENYPDAFNPSIIEFESNYILTFRYSPDPESQSWLSYIGIVLLNEEFNPISEPELLTTRYIHSKSASQSEDARIFSYRGRIFITYNDNIDISPSRWCDKREIFIAELLYDKNHFYLSKPLKLVHEQKSYLLQQKNWMPFEWENKLLFTYTINPHEVLYPNLYSGGCYLSYNTSRNINWKFGPLRGGTPPILVDGEYLAFFHSGIKFASNCSSRVEVWHYFMGAYTFSADPPFQLTKISPKPIVGEGFYTWSNSEKRVIFPGGCVVSESKIHIAYGKDDCEVWIATLDKKALKESLIPIE